ncbi:MAG: hypothetical protein ABR525_04585 [Candidatus Limnocylindria bacterium]
MVRPALTGLATAYFRLFVLDALGRGPARPASLLASASADRLPIANGAFGRALQSLIEGGHVAPADGGAVALTPAGAMERLAERQRWSAVLGSAARLLGQSDAVVGTEPAERSVRAGEPAERALRIAERVERPSVAPAPASPVMPVAEAYLDRVLVATVRERMAAARDGGAGFALALGELDVSHPAEGARRALVHRVVRAMLGGATTLVRADATAYRYGDQGIAVLVDSGGQVDTEAIAAVMGQRLDELLRSTSASVRAFSGARWRVRTGCAAWSEGVPTTLALLRRAQESLATDEERSVA